MEIGSRETKNSSGTEQKPSEEPIISKDGDSMDIRRSIVDEEKGMKQENIHNKKRDNDSVIDIKDTGGVGGSGGGASRKNENPKVENVCRICHFSNVKDSSVVRQYHGNANSLDSELIQLGCHCKGEIGSAHRHCAEAWFTQKGNRFCEICGETAKNIRINEDDTSIFLEEWSEMRVVASTLDSSPRPTSSHCEQSCRNFLFGFLVLAFLLPWFVRGIDLW